MRILSALILFIFLMPAPPARADESCQVAYESAADQYWTIIGDIMQFKVMFDDYDRLCQKYYPDEIAALQPAADHLRQQTNREVKNTKTAMNTIFDTVLPDHVPAACKNDTTARDTVKKKFLAAMAQRTKTLELRMQKSAKSLQNPKESIPLCQQLKPLKPQIEKVLGPALKNPLLEMSILNRTFTKKPAHEKTALKTYRDILKALPEDH